VAEFSRAPASLRTRQSSPLTLPAAICCRFGSELSLQESEALCGPPVGCPNLEHPVRKKETHMQVFMKYSAFLLTIFSLMNPVGASPTGVLPGPSTSANISSVSTQNQGKPVAAIVKAQRANLRDRPSKSGSVLGTVNKGDLLTLINATPIGPWYRVRDSRSDSEGWVHGNTIALLQTTESTSADAPSPQRPRRTLPPATSGRSYVNVDGVRVPSPVFSETKPAGATARCRDGSYSFSQHRRGTYSYHGGVAEWF